MIYPEAPVLSFDFQRIAALGFLYPLEIITRIPKNISYIQITVWYFARLRNRVVIYIEVLR